jgi:hypothetical protein
MAALLLSPADARSVIEMSEGRPGADGQGVGHTRERHIDISRDGLAERMGEPDPQGRYNGEIFWRAAFLDIHSAAALLSQTIAVLNNNPAAGDARSRDFIQNFTNQPDGTLLQPPAPIELPMFDCRDMRGRAWAGAVRVFAQKVNNRPRQFHLITFYPAIAVP